VAARVQPTTTPFAPCGCSKVVGDGGVGLESEVACSGSMTHHMQDRYAGDVGDFLNFGLLRWLIGDGPLRLGVVWYLVPDESHNGDGKHIGYLDPSSVLGGTLRPLDPDLYDRLSDIVVTGRRSVAALDGAGVLPVGTVTHAAPLTFAGLASGDRAARVDRRARWLADALAATQGADVVFVDPDNGLRRDDHATGAYRNRAEKHAYLSEIGSLLARGQSVVAYHHADRSAPVEVQAQRRMDEIADQLGATPLGAVRARRGSTRLFLVIPDAAHRPALSARLAALDESSWARELTTYRWEGASIVDVDGVRRPNPLTGV
jgi:hypothetical protein